MNRETAPLQSPRGSSTVDGEQKQERSLLVFGNVPFSSPWQRSQLLALSLATHRSVVYVDPNRSFFKLLRRSVPQGITAQDIPQTLHQFRPPVGLPFARTFEKINQFNYSRTLTRLKADLVANELDQLEAIILTYPDQVEVLGAFPDVPIVYDLMDEPSLFLKPSQRATFERYHQSLLEVADLVITSSRVLQRRYAARAKPLICITNGIRNELIAELASATCHPLLESFPRPRIGYVGMISHWFDFETVIELAEANKHCSVVLVGPRDVTIPPLPSNVHLTGLVPHLELASILVGFDLGLLPFRRCSAIDAVNPIKVYEYLAAGLPVLSSQFEEITNFSEYVLTYDSPEQAIQRTNSILTRRPTPEEKNRRVEFASHHFWSKKAVHVLTALSRFNLTDTNLPPVRIPYPHTRLGVRPCVSSS